MLEYNWGDDWMVWDATETFNQRGQHGRVQPHAGRRRQDPGALRHHPRPRRAVPEFLIKRAKKIVLDVATESLRKRVMEKYAS